MISTSEYPANVNVYTEGQTGNCGGGFSGGWGGNWGEWIILFLIFGIFGGWGGRGYGGGYGGTGSDGGVMNNYVLTSDFSQLSKQVSDAYSMTERKLDGINNGLCSLGYQELQNITGVNQNLSNGFYNTQTAITTNGYETRNAITQAQIAEMQSFNGVNAAIKDCCCQTQQNLKDVSYNVVTQANALGRQISDTGYAINTSIDKGFCQTNFNNSNNTRDIIASQHSDADRILARLDAMETNRLKEQLDAERANSLALRGALDRAQLRTDIVNDVRPCPMPAYITCNPWAYQQTNSCCGCNQ